MFWWQKGLKSSTSERCFLQYFFDQLLTFTETNIIPLALAASESIPLGLRPHGLLTQSPFGLKEYLLDSSAEVYVVSIIVF